MNRRVTKRVVMFMAVFAVPFLLVVGQILAKEPKKLDRVKGLATMGAAAVSCAVPVRPGTMATYGYLPGDSAAVRASIGELSEATRSFNNAEIEIYESIVAIMPLLHGRSCSEVLQNWREGRELRQEAFLAWRNSVYERIRE